MQNPPWESEIEGITLDIDYFGSRSGFKFCAPLVYNFLDSKGVVTDNGRTAIANVLLARFGKPWTRLWNLLQSEYDPLNNYSVDETRDLKGTNKGKRTLNNETTDTGTRTLTDTGTLKRDIHGNDRTTRSGSNKTETKVEVDTLAENNYAGFNSPSYVQTDGTISTGGSTTTQTDTPGDESTTDSTGDTTDTHNLTNEEQRNLSGSSNGTQDDDFSTTDTGTVKREGVLGFISRQKLLEEERSAWQWDFFESVFADVDSVLALDIYDPCVLEQFDYTGGGGSSGSYVLPRATNNALGGVRAPSKTAGDTVQVKVDSSGYLYVPTYPTSFKLPFASDTSLGGIKLPQDPSGDGEEISTKNGMQYLVDKSLSPDGSYKNDDTVSVVIPYAGTNPGLVKGPAKTSETQQVAISSDGTMWVPESSGGGGSVTDPIEIEMKSSLPSGGGLEFNISLEDIQKIPSGHSQVKFSIFSIPLIGDAYKDDSGNMVIQYSHVDMTDAHMATIPFTMLINNVDFASFVFIYSKTLSKRIVILKANDAIVDGATGGAVSVKWSKNSPPAIRLHYPGDEIYLVTVDGLVIAYGNNADTSVKNFNVSIQNQTLKFTKPEA